MSENHIIQVGCLPKNFYTHAAACLLLFILASCGGGGGGSTNVVIDELAASSVSYKVLDPNGQCPSGGIEISLGVDRNANGTLDEEEVTTTEIICHGASSLVSISSELPGNNCTAGGIKVNSGLDINSNQILDASEITQFEYLCANDDSNNPNPVVPTGSIRIQFQNTAAKAFSSNNLAARPDVKFSNSINFSSPPVAKSNAHNSLLLTPQQNGDLTGTNVIAGANHTITAIDPATQQPVIVQDVVIQPGEETVLTVTPQITHTLTVSFDPTSISQVTMDVVELGISGDILNTSEQHVITSIPPGRYFMAISDVSTGDTLLTRYVNLSADQSLSLNLDQLTANSELTGLVLNRAGDPVENTTVYFRQDAENFQIAITDSSGQFSFKRLRTGVSSLVFQKPGFRTELIKDIQIQEGSNSVDTVEFFAETQTGGISGYAYFNDTIEHSGIDITVERIGGGFATAQFGTLKDGAFLINGLLPGKYNLNIGKSSDTSYSQVTVSEINVIGGRTNVLDRPSILTFQEGSVAGVVQEVQGTSSNLLTGVTLLEPVSGRNTTTSADGSFNFSNIPLSASELQVLKDGYIRRTIPIQLTPSQTIQLGSINLEALEVRGRVLLEGIDPATPNHDGVNILVNLRGIDIQSNPDGFYTLRNVPPGVQTLVFTKVGYVTREIEINVLDNASIDFSLQTMKSAEVRNASVQINNGATGTRSRLLNLTLSAENAIFVEIADNSNFADAVKINYETSTIFDLSDVSRYPEGFVTIYARFLDSSGTANAITSKTATDQIILDTTAPVIGDFGLGSTDTNRLDIQITPTITDLNPFSNVVSGLSFIEISNSSTGLPEILTLVSGQTIDWILSAGNDGNRQVFMTAVDKAGNRSATRTFNVNYSTLQPELTSVTLQNTVVDGTTTYLNNPAIAILTTTNAAASRLWVAENPGYVDATEFRNDISSVLYNMSPGEGARSLYIKARNAAGSESASRKVDFVLDSILPTRPLFSNGESITNKLTQTLNLATASVDANLKGYQINGGALVDWQNVAPLDPLTWPLLENSANTLMLRGIDLAANTSTVESYQISHDSTASVTTVTPAAGNYAEFTTITMASDPGSRIFFTTDGSLPAVDTSLAPLGTTQLYSQPFLLGTEGQHALNYFSVDTAGNIGIQQSSTYVVDKTAPTLSYSLNQAGYNSFQTLFISISDLTSSNVRYTLTTDGTEPGLPGQSSTVYSPVSGISLDRDALWKIRFYAVDALGNQTDTIAASFTIDTTQPVLAVDNAPGAYSASAPLDIVLSVTDTIDTLPQVFYSTDGTEPTTASSQFQGSLNVSFNALGRHFIKAFARDALGNTTAVQTFEYIQTSTISTADGNESISVDTTLTKALSPYRVLSTITVNSAATLTIEPGVELLMDSSIGITVNGSLIARGTVADRIIIRNKDAGESWRWLSLEPSSIDAIVDTQNNWVSGSIVQYVDLINGGNSGSTWGALIAQSSSPYFADITISNPIIGLTLYGDSANRPLYKNINIIAPQRTGIYIYSSSVALQNIALDRPTGSDINKAGIFVESGPDSSVSIRESTFSGFAAGDGFLIRLGTGAHTVQALENNYNTTDYALMKSLIHDGFDDIALAKVQFVPALSDLITLADFDADLILDINDPDDDNDGFSDIDEGINDTSPFDNTQLPVDTDGDFIGNESDTDDDGDGLLDVDELAAGSNPLDPLSTFDLISGGFLEASASWPLTPGAVVLVKGNVIVPEGKSLTITAGTTVRFNGDYSITVEGSLHINGTALSPIDMLPKISSDTTLRWRGIKFGPFAQGAIYDGAGNYQSGPQLTHVNLSRLSGAAISALITNSADGSVLADNRCGVNRCRPLPYFSFINVDDAQTYGFDIDHADQLHIDDSSFSNLNTAIRLQNSDTNRLQRITADTITYGIEATLTQIETRNLNINSTHSAFTASSSGWDSQDDVLFNTVALSSTRFSANNLTQQGSNNGHGLSASSCKLTITNSSFKNNNGSGMTISYENQLIDLQGNTISGNLQDGINLHSLNTFRIRNNQISGQLSNNHYGLRITGSGGFSALSGFVEGNTISNNFRGVSINNASPHLSYNTIASNLQGGLVITNDAAKPKISLNNIHDNGVDTATVQDNGIYDIQLLQAPHYILENNWHGTRSRAALDVFNFDRFDDDTRGNLLYYNYLSGPVDIVARTTPDNDLDGLQDHLDPDDDNDGFIDRLETDLANLTNPFDAADPVAGLNVVDTDLDGIKDNLDTDDDNDGLSDVDEIALGSDPLLVDTDGDGADDAFEVANGSNPIVHDVLSGVQIDPVVLTTDTFVYQLSSVAGLTISGPAGSPVTLTILGTDSIDLTDTSLSNVHIRRLNPALTWMLQIRNGGQLNNVSLQDGEYAINLVSGDLLANNLQISHIVNYGIYGDGHLTLNNSQISYSSIGIYVNGIVELNNSELFRNGTGVFYTLATITLNNSRLFESGTAIQKTSSAITGQLNVTGSEFRDNEMAINSSYIKTITIVHSLFAQNAVAIFRGTSFSQPVTHSIRNSTFEGNGLALEENNPAFPMSITNNVFSQNGRTGLDWVDGSHKNNLYFDNHILGVTLDVSEQDTAVAPYRSRILGSTTAAAINHADGSSTITDSFLALPPNQLLGSCIQTDARSKLCHNVTANTATTITVNATLDALVETAGTSYTVNDYRLPPAHTGLTASDTGSAVGAFDSAGIDVAWGYRQYHTGLSTNAIDTTGNLIADTLSIRGNELWTSDLVLDKHIDTEPLSHIRIQRGKTIRMVSGNALRFQVDTVNGLLLEPGQRIHFTSDAVTPGSSDWDGLELRHWLEAFPPNVLEVSAANICIEQATNQGVGRRYLLRYTGVKVHDCLDTGLYVPSGNAEIRESEIYRNNYGVYLSSLQTLDVFNSRIYENGNGIYLASSNSFLSVAQSDIRDNKLGIYNNLSYYQNLQHNRFVSNGVAIQGSLIDTVTPSYAEFNVHNLPFLQSLIHNNSFDGNGLVIDEDSVTNPASITDNIFSHNGRVLFEVLPGNHQNNLYFDNHVLGVTLDVSELDSALAPYRVRTLGSTTAAALDNADGTSTISDSFLALLPNQLVGSCIQTDARSGLCHSVVSNSATSITVNATLDALVETAGTSYTLYDYRLPPAHPGLTAGSAGAPVGAFDSAGIDVNWGYRQYKEGLTTQLDASATTLLIKGNELWSTDILLDKPINTEPQSHLRIQRGKTIRMAAGNSLTITIDTADGLLLEPGQRTHFTSAALTPQANDWHGLLLSNWVELASSHVLEVSYAYDCIQQQTNLSSAQNYSIRYSGVKLHDCYYSGLNLINGVAELIDSDSYRNQFGIIAGSLDSLRVLGSRLYENDQGIYASSNNYLTISRSDIRDNDIGIFTSNHYYLNLDHNRIVNNGVGFKGDFSIPSITSFTNNNVLGVPAQSSRILYNTFDGNGYGIDEQDPLNPTTVSNNVFSHNGQAMLDVVDGFHLNNLFYDNHHLGVTLDLTELDTTLPPYRVRTLGSSTAAAIDNSNGTSTITDSFLALTANQLLGSCIQTDVRSALCHSVVSNSANSITVNATLDPLVETVATSYTLNDYRLPVGHAGLTLGSAGSAVGAFDSAGVDVAWGYRQYHAGLSTALDVAGTTLLIKGNELWDSDLLLDKHIDTEPRSHLRIQRGKSIRVVAGNSHTITIDSPAGLLLEPGQPIAFSSDSPTPAETDWSGLRLRNWMESFPDKVLQVSDANSCVYQDSDLGVGKDYRLRYTGLDLQRCSYGLHIGSGLAKAIDSDIYNHSVHGIHVAGSSSLQLSGSRIFENATGVYTPSSARLIDISNSELRNNTTAVSSYNAIELLINHSLFRNNSTAVDSKRGSTSRLGSINFSTFDGNGIGMRESYGAAPTSLSNSIFSNNSQALQNVVTSATSNNVFFANAIGNGSAITDLLVNTDPYVSRYAENYRIAPASTASRTASDGGEVGIYGGTPIAGIFAWLGQGITDSITALINRTTVGTMAGNEFWDGTTVLTGDVIVPSGKILRLAPAAILKLPLGNKLVVDGFLQIDGDVNNKAVMTSNALVPAAGDWDGLYLNSSQPLTNLHIDYSINGLVLSKNNSNFSQLMVTNSSAFGIKGAAQTSIRVEDSIFHHIAGTAISLGAGALIEDSQLNDVVDGILLTTSGEVRRNVISHFSASGVKLSNYTEAFIHHNLLLEGATGIDATNYRPGVSGSIVEYNTLNNLTLSGIDMGIYSTLDRVRFNVVSNVADGTSTAYALKGVAAMQTSGNASYLVDNIIAGGATTAVLVPEHLTTNPVYVAPGSIDINTLPILGLYQLIGTATDYRLLNAVHLVHSEYGSQIGAYNLVADITTFNPLISVGRSHNSSFVSNTSELAGDVRFASPINPASLNFDFTTVDSNYSDLNLLIEDNTQDAGEPIFGFSYLMTATNLQADGAGKNFGLSVTNLAGHSETISFNPISLDNTGPTISISGVSEGQVVSLDTTIQATIADALSGGYSLEYQLDAATGWERGDSHLILQSAGSNDGYAAGLLVDGSNVMSSLDGFNVVELNDQTFTYKAASAQSFTRDQIPAFLTYLNGLPEGSLIAVAVKGNGRGSAADNNNLNSVFLQDFNFRSDWVANDAFVAIGYKGARKLKSFSEVKTAGSGNPLTVDLSQLAIPIMNTTFTLSAAVAGSYTLQVRGIDFMGNLGPITSINYTVP